MSPLRVEIYTEDCGWVKVNDLAPGRRPGSLSDNHDGQRDLYIFECSKRDSKSVIYRARNTADVEVGDLRAILASPDIEIVKELEKGEEYELEIQTDHSSVKRRIKFRHV